MMIEPSNHRPQGGAKRPDNADHIAIHNRALVRDCFGKIFGDTVNHEAILVIEPAQQLPDPRRDFSRIVRDRNDIFVYAMFEVIEGCARTLSSVMKLWHGHALSLIPR